MNPILGVFFHWLGGLASGSFYVPYRGVRKWSWEVFWLTGGVFSWIFAPWIAAFLLTNNLCSVLKDSIVSHPDAVGLAFFFGMVWGLGGLTFGLTMRYLGMSLGMAIALGYCTVFGALIPPIFKGTFFTVVIGTTSGVVSLLGVGTCVLGIAIAACAGMSKEREMSEEAKKASIKEFNFVKGLLVATFSGIMSAGFAFGLAASGPITDLSLEAQTPKLWSELPRLCIVLAGGFTTNFIWCLILIIKNKTAHQFLAKNLTEEGKLVAESQATKKTRVPMFTNYLLCAIAGVTWYLQFFFYSLGETQMGIYQFSSWPLHMASIMIFSSLWGIALLEWKGTSGLTKSILALTLTTLIFSTIIMGYGTHIGKIDKEKEFAEITVRINLATQIASELQPSEAGAADYQAKLKLVKDEIIPEAKKLAQYAKPKKGRELDENVSKRKVEGLLDDIGVIGKEVDDKAEKGKKIRVGREKTDNLIAEIDALANTDNPEEIKQNVSKLNVTVQELHGLFEGK
ncbi:MAG: L-rhamnose/proton symporter RhaT [Thermoguttaceae bacterium]